MESLFYVCKHCGRLFSGNGERFRAVMCTGCCEQATYLCTFSWWEGLDLEARRTLVEEYAPSVQLTNDQLMQMPYRRREASPASPQATQAAPTPTHVSRTVAGQPSQNTSWSAPLSSTYRNSQGERNNVALTLGIIGAVSFAIAGVIIFCSTHELLELLGLDRRAKLKTLANPAGWFSFGMAFVSATLGCLGWKR